MNVIVGVKESYRNVRGIGMSRMTISTIYAVHARMKMETKIKKSWHKPKVADYGHVSKLTAGTTGSCTDKGHLANQHGNG